MLEVLSVDKTRMGASQEAIPTFKGKYTYLALNSDLFSDVFIGILYCDKANVTEQDTPCTQGALFDIIMQALDKYQYDVTLLSAICLAAA